MANEQETSTSADDAKARREARKARILGAGSDRLARITKTGRGDEAEALYSPSKALGGASTGVKSSIDDDEVLDRADAALQGGTVDDPEEIDISQASRLPKQSQEAAPFNGQPPQDFQSMIKAMQEAMSGAGPPGGTNADGAAVPNLFPFGQQMAGAPSPPQQEEQASSALDVTFNILRTIVFAGFGIALVYGAVVQGHSKASRSVAENASKQIHDQFQHMSLLDRWARLAYERPAHWEAEFFTVESFGLPVQGIPVFWLFITLEIGLQSMRIMLSRRRPSPPGILLKVASFIPNANAQLLLRTLASYLPLLDAFINDLSIVVFSIGCAIMFAAWKTGLDPLNAPSDGTTALFEQSKEAIKQVG